MRGLRLCFACVGRLSYYYTSSQIIRQEQEIFVLVLYSVVTNGCASQMSSPNQATRFIPSSEGIGKVISDISPGWSGKADDKIFARTIVSAIKHLQLQMNLKDKCIFRALARSYNFILIRNMPSTAATTFKSALGIPGYALDFGWVSPAPSLCHRKPSHRKVFHRMPAHWLESPTSARFCLASDHYSTSKALMFTVSQQL